jgi:sugar lactone lactonase YvrE
MRLFSQRRRRFPNSGRHPRVHRPFLERLEDRTVPSTVPVPSGILSWWAGDGNATDLVGPNNGTLNNGVTFFQGQVADGFNFNNTNYLSAPTTNLPTGKNNRTLELWVKINSLSPNESFFAGYGNFGSSGQTYQVGANNYDHRLYFSQWGTAIFGPVLQTGQWYHVAATNVGNTVTLYLNGSAVATGSLTLSTATGSSFYVGRIPGSLGDTRQLNGEVDEVSIYNRALSASEIQSIYQAGVDGKQKSYLVVDQSSPSEGDVVTSAPTDFTIDFSNPFATSTLQASDLTVNGIPADSVTAVDANTATFHFAASPTTVEGVQTMQMAAGAIQASNGITSPALRAWSKNFRYDPVRLQVTSTSPANNGYVDFANPTLTVNFSEAYDPATVGTDDLILSKGKVTGFSLTSPTSVTYSLSGVTEGALTVNVPAGALADPQGNPLVAYSGSYQIDTGTVAFATPLQSQNPTGSLIYQGSTSGLWNPTGTSMGDLDSFTLNVDANQTLTLRVTSPAQALVTVNHSVLGSLTLPANQDPGTGSLYQTISIPVAGTITIGVQAPDGATTGKFTLQTTLNAQIDQVSDGSAAVQSLDSSAIDVEPGPVTINRATAVGTLDRTVARVLSETEGVTNDLRGSWDQNGTTSVWSINGTGNANTGLNKGVAGSLNTQGLNSDPSDTYSFTGRAGDVITVRIWGSSSGGGTLSTTTLTLQDPSGTQTSGGAVSGASSDRILQSFTLTQTGTYYLIVGTGSKLKGTYTLTADLTTQANPRPDSSDVYSLTVGAPGYLSFAAAVSDQPVSQAQVQLSLYAPGVDPLSGQALALSSSSGTLDALLEYNASTTGTYKVKVTNGPGLTASTVSYNLVAVTNGSFDNTANSGFNTAQDFSGRPGALGALGLRTAVFIPSGYGGLNYNEDLEVRNGNLFVVSRGNNSILRYDAANGVSLGTFASGNGLNNPIGMTFGPDGNLYVGNYGGNNVLRFNGSTGAFMGTFVAAASGGLNGPTGVAFGTDGNLYVASRDSNSILRYNGTTGAFLDTFVASGSGGLTGPNDLVFGPDGNLYVPSQFNRMVLRYNGTAGTFIDAYVPTGSGGLSQPLVVRFGPDGDLYVSSFATNQVLRYQGPFGSQPGTFVKVVIPAGEAGLFNPTGLTFGPDGTLYTSSRANDSVLRSQSPVDFYKVTLAAGQTITFSTSTPGDGPGEFTNALDPHLELYDPSQTLLASGTVLADGRNEQITYTASAAGTYYVKVSRDNFSEGEYVLDPEEVSRGGGSLLPSVPLSPPIAGGKGPTGLLSGSDSPSNGKPAVFGWLPDWIFADLPDHGAGKLLPDRLVPELDHLTPAKVAADAWLETTVPLTYQGNKPDFARLISVLNREATTLSDRLFAALARDESLLLNGATEPQGG